MMTAHKANICLSTNFAFVMIALLAGITSIDCKRSCASCRKSFPQCDYTTGVCKSNCRRTKLCKREDDLCLATWSRRRNKLVMYTSCFRLPPFFNSSQYNAKCKAEILNGTRTCLCKGSDCNRNPSEPVVMRIQRAQQIQLRQKRNLTEDSSTEERTERIPKEKKPSKQANMILWISLAAILISLLLAGLIHRFCTCNSHSKKTLLDGTSPSELDEESTTTDPTDLSSPVTLEERLTQGRYSLSFWKDYSKKTFDTSLSELDECSVTHPNRSVTRDCVTEECVTLEKVLAQGKFSDVWMGHFRGQIVALKIFPVTAISSWRKERYINSILSGEHSNILKLISLNDAETQHNGNCPLWLMMDFCENGSLMDYLKSQRDELSWRESVVITSGITNGVAYLHSETVHSGNRKVSIAHRDLKSSNILVRKDGTCAISDFGLAVSLNSIEDKSKNLQVGTYRYMSPEELLATVGLDSTEAFKQMDIYSMALVLWEVISRCEAADVCSEYQLPFEDMIGAKATLNNMVDIVVLKNCRPHLPDRATDHEGFELICQTVQECWDPDPEARLTADCTQMRLQELLLMT